MPAMTKLVNVRATTAVRNIDPPIYGTVKNIIMTTGDILKCLCKRAQVEEILPDGTTVKLNMKNYFTDNGAGMFAKKPVDSSKVVNKVPDAPADTEAKAPVVETNELTFNEEEIDSSATSVADTTPIDTDPIEEIPAVDITVGEEKTEEPIEEIPAVDITVVEEKKTEEPATTDSVVTKDEVRSDETSTTTTASSNTSSINRKKNKKKNN